MAGETEPGRAPGRRGAALQGALLRHLSVSVGVCRPAGLQVLCRHRLGPPDRKQARLGGACAGRLHSGVTAKAGRPPWPPAGGSRLILRLRPEPQTQEIPSFLIPAAWLLLWATPEQRARAAAPGNAALLATFLLHYFYRDLVFPFRLRGGKPTPLVVWAMALAFCVFNGYMQSRFARCCCTPQRREPVAVLRLLATRSPP